MTKLFPEGNAMVVVGGGGGGLGLELVEWMDGLIPLFKHGRICCSAFNIMHKIRIHNPTSLGSGQDVYHMILV